VYGAFPHGSIEVVCGPMFSGKSEELIRRLRLAIIARQRVQIFKPAIDNRYADDEVVSHSDLRLAAHPIADSSQLLPRLRNRTAVVGLDEAQFFDDGIVEVVESLANRGLRVIVAGLDLDYRGQPFHPMPAIMALAESVQKNQAVCMVCGAPASRSQRLAGYSGAQVEVGSSERYEARCRRHFEPEEELQLSFLRTRNHILKVPMKDAAPGEPAPQDD